MADHLRPLSGLVLAGGESRRMGFDKGGLHYHGAAMREHVAALLAPHCEAVYLSLRPEQAAGVESGWPALLDPAPNLGPMAGIWAAFAARPDAAWLVVACDMPLLGPAALAELVRHRQVGFEAVAFRGAGDRPEPMAAIWEPIMGPRVAEAVAACRLSPRDLLRAARCRLLTPEPSALLDANTPEAREAVLRRLAAGN